MLQRLASGAITLALVIAAVKNPDLVKLVIVDGLGLVFEVIAGVFKKFLDAVSNL